ncbi:hypothetical protein WJX73_003751 [Symbiochloris irregularis]|uniref:RING-type domain-containing protein n=1 Tax=Symbiochloris irregularis TaxID=706552 RepID=A0AAW1PRG4_9CHLO
MWWFVLGLFGLAVFLALSTIVLQCLGLCRFRSGARGMGYSFRVTYRTTWVWGARASMPGTSPGIVTSSGRCLGLPEEALKRLPSFTFTGEAGEPEQEQEECAVCQEPLTQHKAAMLPCSHTFHSPCLRQWLAYNASCPTCRLAITERMLGYWAPGLSMRQALLCLGLAALLLQAVSNLCRCAVSKTLSSFFQRKSSTRSARLAVYIYDLPAEFHNLTEFAIVEQDYASWTYGAETRVAEMLAKGGYVTADPAAANLFYAPAWLYAYIHQPGKWKGGLENPSATRSTVAVQATVAYINSQYPYWKRKGGKDHMFVLTQDHGFCGFDGEDDSLDDIANAIIVSHWGLTSYESPCFEEKRTVAFDHCPEREAIDAALAKGQPTPHHLPCFVPDKDVVIPPASWDALQYEIVEGAPPIAPPKPIASWSIDGKTSAAQQAAPLAAWYGSNDSAVISATVRPSAEGWTFKVIEPEKEHKLFFAGATRHHQHDYSHGVRQTAFDLFSDTEGFMVVTYNGSSSDMMTHGDMVKEMGRSHFCLAPSGGGWGDRLKLAVLCGCIPVVIQDKVKVAFEDVLPYQEFAVRLPQHMLYRLPHIIDTLLDGHINKTDPYQFSQAYFMRERVAGWS